MKQTLTLCFVSLIMAGCSHGEMILANKIDQACGDKPNCVSTIEQRERYQIAPFTLNPRVTINQIEQVALELPGAKTVVSETNYLHLECTSKVIRFVDDLELKIEDSQLIVRSESRVGYSDFGVNKKRTDQLRLLLEQADLLKK